MKRCITSDEAPKSNVQHKSPCIDCPFARTALPGWLGNNTPEEWVSVLHGDGRVDCHAIIGPECAGAAIYRANICKMPRDKTLLRLSSDRERVFVGPQEFLKHHQERMTDRKKVIEDRKSRQERVDKEKTVLERDWLAHRTKNGL